MLYTRGAIPSLNCTGCMACLNACSRGAIDCTADAEGFSVPVVNQEKCISCGKCVDICPEQKPVEVSPPQNGFLVARKNEKLRKGSTSAGVFYELAEKWIRTGGIVCGAVLCEDMIVRHQLTDTIQGLERMRGSKYVQSSIEKALGEIREQLNKGKHILFCGTPCQVAAIRKLFHGNEENLLCVDLVCHGVPSPEWLRKYIDETVNCRAVKNISFRTCDVFEHSGYNIEIQFQENDRRIKRCSYLDTYMNIFLKGKNYRESCYQCKYSNIKRSGDLTIGDCASFRNYRNWIGERTASIVLINGDRGSKAWNLIKEAFEVLPLNIELEERLNHSLHASVARPKSRDKIGRDLLEKTIREIRKEYASCSVKEFLGIAIRRALPSKLRFILLLWRDRIRRMLK